MRVLITGSSGFVGKYLAQEFENHGYEVVRCSRKAAQNAIAMDINDPEMVHRVLQEHMPDVIVNMAGQASVGISWKEPRQTVLLNTIGFVNILEAVRALNLTARVIAVGSSDEYGVLADKGADVTEDVPVNPMNPYAISKGAQELFARVYARSYGLDICMIRLFNLGGAGQSKGYVISDFSSGIAEVEAGKKEYLSVGNLESARDFTHVKDAVRAVRLIVEKGHSGEVYNIASGVTHTAQEVLDKLIGLAKAEIKILRDPARMRPSDTPVIRGNHDKLTAHTGWQPELGFDEMLEDALDYWREHI